MIPDRPAIRFVDSPSGRVVDLRSARQQGRHLDGDAHRCSRRASRRFKPGCRSAVEVRRAARVLTLSRTRAHTGAGAWRRAQVLGGGAGDRGSGTRAHRPDPARVRRLSIVGASRVEVRADGEGPPHGSGPRGRRGGHRVLAGLRRERRDLLRPALPASGRAGGWCRCASPSRACSAAPTSSWSTSAAISGLDPHHGGTTADGAITVQEAQCLGACDRAPCIQVDAENMVGPLTPDAAVRLVDELRDAPAPSEIWR